MFRRILSGLSSCAFLLVVAGCSTSANSPIQNPTGSSRYNGVVHGGQQPVAGASIQLYTVGTTADGSAATPLLTQAVTSDASGNFSITGLYSCTNATQVYLVATGGNPGVSAANPNIALMAALGPCSSLTPSMFIDINELTTVAAVSALAPYMNSISAIGSSPTDASLLASAFTLANELVDTGTGAAPGINVPTGYTVPVEQLNTLADILSACINSTGGIAGDGSLCGNLFSLTTIGSNAAPTNTIAAMLNLANNPMRNTGALYALVPPTPAFQPTLNSVPASFLVQMTASAGSAGLQVSPASIAFPDTAVSFSSQPQTVTIENTGSSTVTFNSIAIAGANASDFAVNNACGSSLNAGDSCTVQITATPSANGARSGFLVISSSSPISPQYVAMSVNGTAASAGPVTLSATSLNFTMAGVLQDVTVSNYGTIPLTISAINETDAGVEFAHNFAVANSTCGTSLPAQSVCTISVVSQLATGDGSGNPLTSSGTITIVDDASSGPQTISLSSRNLGSIASTSSSILGIITFPASQLGTTQTAQAQYAGYNAYDEAGWPSISVSLTGLNPSDFSETITQSGSAPNMSNCTPGLYGQSNCMINFSFTPSATGSRTAKAIFPSGYVLLSGTGVGPGPSFRVDQTSLTMASELPSAPDPNSIGSSTLTLTNNGTTTLNIGASFTGANPTYMSANTASCASVAPQATCTITVSFNAPSVGNYSANIVLKDNNSSFSYTPIPITASTRYWYVYAFPRSVSFSGNQAVGTTSAAQTFVLADANQYPIGHPISVSLQPSSNFALTQGSTCAASSTQTCTLAVAFAPQTTGNISETATITDQTTGLQTTLGLTGTAIPAGAPAYTLSASSVTFPSRSVNTTSIPTVVTVTSTGTQTLSVSGIGISGVVNNNFTETNNCGSVPVNGTCSINITFAPTAAGVQSATLQITSNAVSSSNTIALSGTATSP